MSAPSNFAPIDTLLPDLAKIGREAEVILHTDAHATMVKLRVFGEALAQQLLDLFRLPVFSESQFDRLQRLAPYLDEESAGAFHRLRKEGNKAAHETAVSVKDAMVMLRSATNLVRWYWQTQSTCPPPAPGLFVVPSAPERKEAQRLAKMAAQLEAERQKATAAQDEAADLMRLLAMPQVATWSGLDRAYLALTEAQQQRVGSFLLRFREEPIHEDWPIEPRQDLADDKIGLVTLDDVVLVMVMPPRADLIMVVHVAPPEQAVAWAAGKRFQVNPFLGTLQVFDVDEAEEAVRDEDRTEQGGLLAHRSDQDLLAVGLPQALLPAVRAVSSKDALDALLPHLPPEAADALVLLLDDRSLSEVLEPAPTPAAIDEQDFAGAIHHPQSKRSFLVLEDDTDLQAVLEGSIEAWRIYLHPDQRSLVQMNANGPVRALGGAGTGKTVALLHRTKHLVQDVFTEPEERLWVTTYTKNLVADLRHQLAQLVTADELNRIDVINLHAYAAGLWQQHGDGRHRISDAKASAAWSRAMSADTLGYSMAFYQDEWRHVVQQQGITEEIDYLRARRTGRGVSLNRGNRREAWKVLAAYRDALDEKKLVEHDDILRLLTDGLESGQIPRAHVAALADEVQDFGAPELRFLRAAIAPGPSDLFLVGDTHQRIYGRPVQMGRCGIEIRGRSRRLKVNYRTTARVRSWAVGALTGESFDDMDGGSDTLDGYRSLRLGVPPEVKLLPTRDAEREEVVQQVRAWVDNGGAAEQICVAAPTNKRVADLSEALAQAGYDHTVLQSDQTAAGQGVRLATFHRLKGLEFPKVVLTGVQEGEMPQRNRAFYDLDDESRAMWDKQQRCLLYVAATRARDELVVLGSGKKSEFLGG